MDQHPPRSSPPLRSADARAVAGLVSAARELGAARTELEVLQVVTDRGVDLLGARAMGLALPGADGSGVRTLSTSFDAEFLASVEHLPRDLPLPLVHSAVTGSTHFLSDLASTAADFPAAADLYPRAGVEASAAVPLWSGEHLLGSLSVAMARPHRWRQPERELLEALAGLTAQALDRLAAHDAERVATAQQAALVAVAQALGRAESEEQVFAVVAADGVGMLGAYGSGLCLREADGSGVRTLASDTVDDDVRAQLQHLPAGFPMPLVHTAVTGEALFLRDRAEAVARFPGAEALFAASRTEASACAPLHAGGQLLGSLSLAVHEARSWSPSDRDLVATFATLTAQALDRISSREGERTASAQVARFSETLQRSLLTKPAALDHLQVAVRYSPAVADAQVGGDWYDAFSTRSGTTHLVIGDVTGHDSRAAAAMGQMRNLLRGIGHAVDDAPAAVLSALDRAVHDLDVGALATVVLAQVERDPDQRASGRRTVRWSSAGHLPPLLVTPGAASRYLETAPDLLVGLVPGAVRHDHEVVLPPGSVLLLFTDGLVERRGTHLQQSLDWLAETTAGLAHLPLEELCDALLALVGDRVEDDVALLALCAHPADPLLRSDTGALHQVVLPASPGSPRRARDAALGHCRAAGVAADLCDVVQLLTSELATNAVLHARSPVRLSVLVTAERVLVEVGDDDSRHPRVGGLAVEALGGRGVVLVDLLASSWGVRDDAVGKTVWFTLDRG